MKKVITLLAICSMLLSGCGQIDDAESKPVTTTTTAAESTADTDTTETSSAKEEKDTSEAATTALKTSSQTVSSSSSPTGTTVTTTKKSGSSNANGNSNQGQNNSVQNNNGQGNNYQPAQNNPQPDNSPSNDPQSNNGAEQNNRPSDNNPNNTPSPPVTTAKPVVTNPPTTTTKPQTTVPQTEPPAPEPNDQVVDINAVSDQMWVFLECYPIDYSGMYNAGKQLSNDGSDISKARAVSNYAYNQGGRNCIEYALNAYFLAKGAGLECYIARSSKYDWYGHVANVIKLDGEWYYMEPQDNIVGSPTTYAAGGTASDGSVISYPDGLDVVTDIYDNQISVKISQNWYE